MKNFNFIFKVKILVFIIPMYLILSAFQGANIQDVTMIKSLFIYNFTKHIEWPSQKISSPKFQISVLGSSIMNSKLTSILKDRKVIDKPIEVKEITNIEEAFNSEILFIAQGQGDKLNAMLDKCSGKAILIITEEKKMSTHGASINIYEKDSHLRFELNDVTIKREGFKVSNQLYELATVSR